VRAPLLASCHCSRDWLRFLARSRLGMHRRLTPRMLHPVISWLDAPLPPIPAPPPPPPPPSWLAPVGAVESRAVRYAGCCGPRSWVPGSSWWGRLGTPEGAPEPAWKSRKGKGGVPSAPVLGSPRDTRGSSRTCVEVTEGQGRGAFAEGAPGPGEVVRNRGRGGFLCTTVLHCTVVNLGPGS